MRVWRRLLMVMEGSRRGHRYREVKPELAVPQAAELDRS